ncbi:MAG: hypothetical protein KHX55_04155 [Proteobacteria bacterium]|nr:hypothetical protein [Pseudomonadota bacterium]
MNWSVIRKTMLATAAVLLAAGCASTAGYDARLNGLVGENTQRLTEVMGRPSAKKITADGQEVWSYTKVDDVYVPSEFYLYDQGAMSNEYGGLYAPFMDQYDFSPYEKGFGYTVKYYCQTAFLIEHQTVIGWKRRGNGCSN